MKKVNQFFLTHLTITRILLWSLFTVALAYALVILFLLPDLNFYLILIPMIPCFYFFWIDKKGGYNPEKDRFSDQYVPYKDRKKKK